MVASSNCEDENDYLDLFHMFDGALRFLQFTRNWTIPENICIDGIFNGAEICRVFYPGKKKRVLEIMVHPENRFYVIIMIYLIH